MEESVKDWLSDSSNEDDIAQLFYNMSATMKYIHNHSYYISDFNMDDIKIKDIETLAPIEYTHIEKMDYDDNDIINDNIHTLALIQLGVYSNTLEYLNPKFAETNFKEFELFIPEKNDIPYLRGAIQRHSPVYYCDFVNARNEREIKALADAAGESASNVVSMQKAKSTAAGRAMTDKVNEKLYGDFENNEAAFATFMILPLVMTLVGIILSIIMLVTY